MNFWRFDTTDPSLGRVLEGTYDPLLVALSIVIACFAGVTALALADRMTASVDSSTKAWWHLGGAVAMGCGIWSMHFTAMLAFSMPEHSAVSYDAGLTLISLFPAIIGSAAALYFIARTQVEGLQLQLCALLMAVGIGTMHYTGMEAMRMEGLRYDFGLFVLSIVVAHLLALTALTVRSRLRRLRAWHENVVSGVAGTVMGFAVAGMHYTAMAASRFHEIPDMQMQGSAFSDATLAASIGGFAGLILGLSIMATWIDRQIGFQRLLHLEKMAHTDPLTGLPNRVLFQDQLLAAQEHNRRHRDRFALLFLDLDKFKEINDTLGHGAGDHVLKEVAARIQAALRGEDIVARLGGDEFVVLVRDLEHAEDAVDAAERLLRALEKPIELDKRRVLVGVSVGISICPDDSEHAEELKQQADAAMYRAKADGLGYCFFDESLTDRAMERVRFGSDLREALRQGQLFMLYQPWVDLDSRRWLGLEALARWTHPTEGDIPPAVFIPLAERCGLVQQFGEWALRSACRQGREWLDSGLTFERLAVNISTAHFGRQDFVSRLQHILEETGFPAGRLELEMAESCLMDNTAQATERLTEIRDLGVSLAIDDFGTGYTSFGYLKDAPIDRLKIDRALTQKLPGSRKDLAIVRAVIDMGSSLEFAVLAKGVEGQEQRNALLKLGCRQGQGFLFARPLTVEAVESALPQHALTGD